MKFQSFISNVIAAKIGREYWKMQTNASPSACIGMHYTPPAALDGMHCSAFICIFQYSLLIFAAIVHY